MSLNYSQRMADPRWQKANELFGATFEVTGELATANPHAYCQIRFGVREAALGAPDSCFDDPDAELEREVRRWIKPEARATAVLQECQRIVRSAREAKGRRPDWECAVCGWPWPLGDYPPAGSECDNCGGELIPVGGES